MQNDNVTLLDWEKEGSHFPEMQKLELFGDAKPSGTTGYSDSGLVFAYGSAFDSTPKDASGEVRVAYFDRDTCGRRPLSFLQADGHGIQRQGAQ